MACWPNLAIDPLRSWQRPVHGKQAIQGDTKERFVLFEVGSDEGPVLSGERNELTTVELVIDHLLLSSP
jgi:hypothetical protein